MGTELPENNLELRSTVTTESTLVLSLDEVPIPVPKPAEVLVRVEAAPINPSDLGLLLAGAEPASASFGGSRERPVVTIPLEARAMRALAGRVGVSMTVGNEGAGVVVAAGSDDAAQALVGRTVAIAGGSMYSQYRCVPATQCLVLPDGTAPREGASSFVNPMTALGMIGTLRAEGHAGLVHTAAASNLGQMLVKLCIEDEVPLVNVVRTPEQARLLSGRSVPSTSATRASSSFMTDLIAAIADTGATLAFDAIGGGTLASQILTCMEAAASASAKDYSRYGSTTHKQVYIYGGLDTEPDRAHAELRVRVGARWLARQLRTCSASAPEDVIALRQRVLAGLSTTFASTYTKDVSLAEALQPAVLQAYARRATGEKYLVVPTRG